MLSLKTLLGPSTFRKLFTPLPILDNQRSHAPSLVALWFSAGICLMGTSGDT